MNTKRDRSGAGAVRLGTFSSVPGGMLDLLLATLFINLLSLAMPLALLQIYDRILPNAAESTLSLLIIGVGTALILEAFLRLGRSYVSGWMGARFEYLAGCGAMQRLLGTSISEFERQGSGVHLEQLNSLGTLKEFYAGQAILVLCDLPFAVIYLSVIFHLAGWLVLVPIGLITFFALSALGVGRRLHKALDARMIADDRRFNFIIEALGGIHTLKSMAMENQILRRYEKLQESCAEADHKVVMNSSSALNIGALFSQVSIFTVVGLGATLVIDGALTVGGLVACTMLSGRSMQPMQKAAGIWTRFQAIRLARDRVGKLFELEPESEAGLPELPPVTGAIELQNVSFGFGRGKDGEDLPLIVKNVNLKVAAGETVGISGGNASGKSTLLSLMKGVLRPTEGSVLIDGNDLGKFDPVSVRGQIAYLPQHGEIFNGTILENISMFRPEREEAALETAKRLGLDSIVARMPLGYDSKVGEGAHEALARGIKQRIAIACALVDRPRVLLFDEANTALDSKSDNILHAVLENMKGHCTLVLVTHRPSLLKLSDRRFHIEDGYLTEPEKDAPQLIPPPAKEVSA